MWNERKSWRRQRGKIRFFWKGKIGREKSCKVMENTETKRNDGNRKIGEIKKRKMQREPERKNEEVNLLLSQYQSRIMP